MVIITVRLLALLFSCDIISSFCRRRTYMACIMVIFDLATQFKVQKIKKFPATKRGASDFDYLLISTFSSPTVPLMVIGTSCFLVFSYFSGPLAMDIPGTSLK